MFRYRETDVRLSSARTVAERQPRGDHARAEPAAAREAVPGESCRWQIEVVHGVLDELGMKQYLVRGVLLKLNGNDVFDELGVK